MAHHLHMARSRLNPRFSNVFRAGEIATPIAHATRVELTEDPQAARRRLAAGRFDQAPVFHRARVVGWVKTVNLGSVAKVKGAMKPLAESALVSAGAPLSDALTLLGENDLVFTVAEGLSGFIAPSDMDRHAARSHFYLLVAAIEMLLSDAVRRRATNDEVIERITDEQRSAWTEAHNRNAEADPVEYLYLQDLEELFSAKYRDHEAWSNELRNSLVDICHFRSRIMHPTRSLTANRSARQMAALARGSENVITALTALLEGETATAEP